MHSLEHSMNHDLLRDDLQQLPSSFYMCPSLPQLSTSTSHQEHQEHASTYWMNSAVLQGPQSTTTPFESSLYIGALPQLFTPPSYYLPTTSQIFAGYNFAGPTFRDDLHSASLGIGSSSAPSTGTSSAPLPSTIPSRGAPTPTAPNSLHDDSTVSDLSQTAAPALPQQRETEIFIGEKQVSKFGKHDVLICRIPGTRHSFTFFFKFATKHYDVYCCRHCRQEIKRRGERDTGENIKVIGNRFLTDPCRLSHECNPAKYTNERGDRHVYKELQSVRSDPIYAEKKPAQIYLDMVARPIEADDEDMEDCIRAAVRKSGYQARRRNICRSAAVWTNRSVTMEYVPPEYRVLRDGSVFLHHHEPGFHIYYCVATIERACDNQLHSIVADGMHSLHPKSLGYQAQLYCVHGVCERGVEIPLLYCITAKKTERVYLKIFEELRTHIVGQEWKAVPSILHKHGTVKETMKLELKQYIQGGERDERIVQWWATLKGMVFLPEPLLPQVRALRGPPVPNDHIAYKRCGFISYLHTTWMDGPFKGLWCKWKLTELRTTNLAEAFHRRLGLLINGEHPPLSVLIEALRKLNYEARAALRRLQEDPEDARKLLKRDANRRAVIAEEMRKFEECYRHGVSESQIEEYCVKMSRFVTNTTI